MAEVGRFPLFFNVILITIKYWIRLFDSENILLDNWVCNIRKELCIIGLNDLRNSQAMLSKNVIFLIKQRLLDIAKQEFDAVLSVSSKCHFDQYIVTNVCLQEYLCKPIPALYKQCITKIRLSSHRLAILNKDGIIKLTETEEHVNCV
jgi:hypothetical protein